MPDRTPTPGLQLADVPRERPLTRAQQDVLDRILDPTARKVYEAHLRAGTLPPGASKSEVTT